MTSKNGLRDQYLTDGYVHLSSFIAPSTLEKLIFRMREIVALKSPQDFSKVFDAQHQKTPSELLLESASKISCFFDKNAHALSAIDKKKPFKTLNKVGHALHELCPVYRNFSLQEPFFALMKNLGQKKPRLVQSMFIFKQPKFGDSVPAHQDATFIYQEKPVIGLWFALEDAHVDNGCLWVMPGGHKGPLKERFINKAGELAFMDKKRVSWPKKAFIPLEAKAGDLIILHGLLPHLSEQNRSSMTRYAYTLHFIDDAVYFPKDNWLNSGSRLRVCP